MRTVEIRTCAEIEVFSAFRIQHGIHGVTPRRTNRRRRQSEIHIRIVRRFHPRVLFQDTVQCIVIAERHGRVGLEFHTDMKPVQVYACNKRIFRNIVRFATYNAGKRHRLHLRKSLSLRLLPVLIGPESIECGLLFVQHHIHGIRPIDLIGIGDEQSENILRSKAVTCKQCGILQRMHHGQRVHEHLAADFPCQCTAQPDGPGQYQIHRCLPSVLQHPRHINACIGRFYGIMPCLG